MDPELRAELREAVDEVWAERVRHLPMDAGEPDTSREPSEFTALLRTGDRTAEEVNFGRGNSSRGAIVADGGFLRLDRSEFPDLELRKHDKLVALDRDSQPIFEVMHVDDRSHLRLICELGDA